MSDLGLSTIAQLLFPHEQSIDFARTVAELEGVLSKLQSHAVRIAWDCDDFVCFDIPGTRIQLAWSEVDRRGYKACLSVSVGPGEVASRGYHEDMCSRLVDRIQTRFQPVAVLWCQADGLIGAEVIDGLLDALPHLGTGLPDIESLVAALTAQEARLSRGDDPAQPVAGARPVAAGRVTQVQPAPRPLASAKPAARAVPVAANDQPDLPLACDTELRNVRRALYPDDAAGPPYSTQMRLAVHCLNATLILVWAPMGAAMMTYSILRGENMRLSSRVMAVSGTLFALAHSPVGMTVAAMAGSIN